MTRKLRLALASATALVLVLFAGLMTGAFDDAMSRLSQLAGRESGGITDVVATGGETAVPSTDPSADPAAGLRVVPIFDLVRVEPTGDAVIAGQGVPDAEVEILSGVGVIASGKANAAGEWAVVLSEPLRAGAHDLTVRTRLPSGDVLTSEQSVAVSVPQGGEGEVLVVLNQPGSASTLLQVPDAPEATVAAVDTAVEEPVVAPVETPAAADADADADTAGQTEIAAASDTALAPTVEAAASPSVEGGASVVIAPVTAEAGATDAGAEGGADMAANGATVVAVEPGAADGAAIPDVAAGAAAADPAGVLATGPAPDASDAPEEIVVAAVEPASEPSGDGTDATAADPMPKEDLIAAPVAVDTSAAEAPAVAETAGEPAPVEVAAVEPAAVEPAPAPVPVTIEAVELENGARFFAAGAAAPGAGLRVYVDDAPVKDVAVMPTGRWLLDTPLSLQAGSHVVRVDQIDVGGQVVARAEVPFVIADEATRPTAVSGSGAAGTAAGSAGEARVGESETLIIRQGDNLWHIARRLYGRGVRYSTIYDANTDQIRNPDLIYPGQVFVIPQGDTRWSAEAEVQ